MSRLCLCFAVPVLSLAGCDSELSVREVRRFAAEPGPPPLFVTSVDPLYGESGVAAGAIITITFSRPLADLEDLGPRPVILAPAGGGAPLGGLLEAELEGARLVFHPASPLAAPSVLYRIDLGPDVRAADGGALDRKNSPVPIPSEFTTVDRIDFELPSFGGIRRLGAVSSSALRAGWEPATDDVTPVERIVYRVYLGRAPGGEDFSTPQAVSAPGATEVLVPGLLPDTLYFALVRAVDELGQEDRNTAELSGRTLAERDTVPPSFAGAREARPLSTTSLEVSWEAATDNRDASADLRYRIYIRTGSESFNFASPRLVTEPGAGSAEVNDLNPDQVYLLVVRAADTSGNEDSNQTEISGRPLASFAFNISPTLHTNCTSAGCHNAVSRAGGLNVTTHATLISGGFTRNPNTIKPGDGRGSYILWRTDERNPNFRRGLTRMPQGRLPVSPAFLDTLIRWIDQDARNN